MNAIAVTEIQSFVYGLRTDFNDVCSDDISFEKEAGFALQILRENEYLSKAAAAFPSNLRDAIVNVAGFGVSLNPAKKQAYLIPRNKGGATKVYLDISYMGMLDIATKSGCIDWAQAKCVHENDNYINNGLSIQPTHKYNPFDKERGAFVGVYVCARLPSCDVLTHEVPAAKIWDIAERSESYKAYKKDNHKKTPWVTDFDEMAKKTCIKQAAKTWPRIDKLDHVINYLNTEGNEGLQFGEYKDTSDAGKCPVDLVAIESVICSMQTDADCLALWRQNSQKLNKWPQEKDEFRNAIAARREFLNKQTIDQGAKNGK